MSTRAYHRKNYLVDKKFQLAFIMRFCTVVILSSLVIGALIFTCPGTQQRSLLKIRAYL